MKEWKKNQEQLNSLIKQDKDYNDYLSSLTYRDIEVDVFVDDYGQCFYIKFKLPNTEEVQEIGLGTYNLAYKEETQDIIDYLLNKQNL